MSPRSSAVRLGAERPVPERGVGDAVRLPPRLPPPGAGGQPYEYLTAVYRPDPHDPRGGRRYTGHHARILDEQGAPAPGGVPPPGQAPPPLRRVSHTPP